MINIFDKLREFFIKSAREIAIKNGVLLEDSDFSKVVVEPSKDRSHGDFACNIAMILSKKFSTIKSLDNSKKLAESIKNNTDLEVINKLEIAGPGFINIFIKDKILFEIIASIVNEKIYKFKNIGNQEKINLEYASPNPTGPIHVGHTRGAIFGDVLANLLKKTGYDVTKEYYINDAGSQIENLVKSAYIRYLQASGDSIEIPEGLYPGDYLIEIGKTLFNNFQDSLKDDKNYFDKIRDIVVNEMIKIIVRDLEDLGIKHDSYFSEKKELHDKNKITEALEILKKKGLIYVGKLEIPKTAKGVGANIEGYDDKDQTLFKSTLFGDDQDRVVIKADGSPTYFAGDIAYSLSKFRRGAKKFIMPLGYDHAGYIKRLNAAVMALTDNKAELKVILCQMVKFVKNGQPLKMSKRANNFITAKDVIDEVGADVLRFMMLTRKNDAPFDFDLQKAVEQSKDNPIFYVQYAHARCCSVLRNLENENFTPKFSDKITIDDLIFLKDEAEFDLIKKISNFPRIIENSVENLEPHRIAFYLQDLASSFHSLWNKGSENPDLKFIISDNSLLTKSRIYLIIALKIILSTGLEIFNIKPLEKMR